MSNTVHSGAEKGCAAIENMEGAALFALAREYGFGVVEIRAISNRVGEEFACWRVGEAVEALARELSNLKFE